MCDSILTSVEYWTDEIQKGNPVDVLYVDFKKAFDQVPHKRLLTKLKAYGITGKLLNWIYSFLVGRKQRVTINSFKSTWIDVVSRVPQGSVLGPIFFLIYINDLPHVLSNPCLLTPKFIVISGVKMIYVNYNKTLMSY